MKVSTRYPLQPRRTNKSIIDETSEKEPIPEKKKKERMEDCHMIYHLDNRTVIRLVYFID